MGKINIYMPSLLSKGLVQLVKDADIRHALFLSRNMLLLKKLKTPYDVKMCQIRDHFKNERK